MNRKILLILVALIIFGAIAFLYVLRPPALPSRDISSFDASGQSGEVQNPEVRELRILSSSSTAEFRIGEVLGGKPFTVIGATNQIAGNVIIDPSKKEWLSLGVVRVNARTLKTDDSSRDGAISRFILKSEDPQNEFIEFKAVGVNAGNFPKEGENFTLTISGNLKISGVIKPVVWIGTGKISGDSMFATAETTVKRGDFNLVIPSVPFVASVDEDVVLKVSVMAVPK